MLFPLHHNLPSNLYNSLARAQSKISSRGELTTSHKIPLNFVSVWFSDYFPELYLSRLLTLQQDYVSKIQPFPFSIQHPHVYLKLTVSPHFYVASRAWFPVFLFQSSLWGLCSCLYLLTSVWHPCRCGNFRRVLCCVQLLCICHECPISLSLIVQ